MKTNKSQILFGLSLVLLSAIFYFIHYAVFRDAHHIFIYLVGDVAFVFIEVLLVTLIIHQLLSHREKRALLKKMNMAIGAFFSEVGTGLLKIFSDFNLHSAKIDKVFIVDDDWTDQKFLSVSKTFNNYDHEIDCNKGDLNNLLNFLKSKRNFLINLLQNPNLLEHESFTNLLWAVFHLTEELESRADVGNLSDTDCEHIAGDIKRAYVLLISEWLLYMKHLRNDYPYLFSLAIRTNPFDPYASPEVK
ncbi:MAG: hypothetical protein Q7J27_06830 [Syntrophales bacterium]|nr:hypothetical protein [Syntrophales bacterium]